MCRSSRVRPSWKERAADLEEQSKAMRRVSANEKRKKRVGAQETPRGAWMKAVLEAMVCGMLESDH